MGNMSALGQASLLTLALVVATVLTHYQGLSLMRRLMLPRKASHVSLVGLMFGVLALHIIEILIYSAGYWFGDIVTNIGHFSGPATAFRDYIYFSAETYTTLGLGGIYPLGDLRMIASIETLNGILMLGWSTSFTFLVMQRQWGDPSSH